MLASAKRQVAIPLVAFTMVGGESSTGAVLAAVTESLQAAASAALTATGRLAGKAAEAALTAAIKWTVGLLAKTLIVPVMYAAISPIIPPSAVCEMVRRDESPGWSSPRCPLPSTPAGLGETTRVTILVAPLAAPRTDRDDRTGSD